MSKRAENTLVVAAALLFTALFTYLAWRRQDAFAMGRFDLGNMSQAVWSTAQGQILAVTDPAGNQVVRLGLHVDPILVLLAPLYWLWADPKVLLLVQAGVVAAGAFPLLWLARAELAGSTGRWLPVVLAVTYLLYPPLQYATLDEFHPVTLAAPLLLYLIWYLRAKRYLPAAIFALLAITTKEEVSLLIAALGIYTALAWKRPRAGVLLFVAGSAWFVLATSIVIPHFNSGGGSDLLSRYEAVGGSVGAILKTALTDPLQIAAVALEGKKLAYLAALLAPLLFLPLAAPLALLVALPEFAINLLSSHGPQTSYHFHYLAPLVPFIFWAELLALRRLAKADLRIPSTSLLLAAVLVSGWLMGPIPLWSKLPFGSDFKADTYSPSGHDRVAQSALRLIPPDAAVSATNQFGAHLSERRRILPFPQLESVDYILFDRAEPSYGDARKSPDGELALKAVRHNRGYRLIFSKDGVLVFKAKRSRTTNQSTKSRLRATRGQTKSAPKTLTSP